MKKTPALMLCCIFLATASLSALATPATDAEFAQFRKDGGKDFSAAKGKKLFTSEVMTKGQKRSCTLCHGTDLTKSGKHNRTHKVIKPMAPSVNPKRFTDVKKINKWLKRNCEWTFGHECSAQEKGDLLKFFLSQ